MLSERHQSSQDCILPGSTYIILSKLQNYGDEEKITYCQGLESGGIT